jgi:Na+/proline symporter
MTYLVCTLVYMGIAVYAPALALSAITKFDVDACIFFLSFIFIVYAALGGIRAIIWSDAIQVTRFRTSF